MQTDYRYKLKCSGILYLPLRAAAIQSDELQDSLRLIWVLDFIRQRCTMVNEFMRQHGFTKHSLKTPSDSTNTKGQSIEWQTPEIEGTVMVVEGFDGDTYEDTAIFTTEGAAKSWLFAKANIMPNADRSQLNSKITEISELDPEDYTSTSWATLYNKLTEVQVATRKTYMSQTEVNALYAGLQTAYVAL